MAIADIGLLLLKVTIALAMGLIALRVAARQPAAVRHFIIVTTLATLVLIPLAAALLPPLPIVVARQQSLTEPGSEASVASDEPRSTGPVAAVRESGIAIATPPVLIALWAAGAIVCLLPAAVALAQSRRLRREGRVWSDVPCLDLSPGGWRAQPVPVLLHERLCGPVTCSVLSPVILLPADAPAWSEQDLRHALTHELAHVRRVDVLVHGLARAVCAAYWFHPLVWVCWRALRMEAERACDDEVVGVSEPTAYAAQLLRIARRHGGQRPVASLPTMARRSELAVRVHAVLDRGQERGPLGAARAFRMAAVVGVCAIVLSCVTPTVVHTSTSQQGDRRALAFSSASIRRNTGGQPMTMLPLPGSSVRITGAPVRALVRLAYDVQDHAILDAPDWLASERFDIDATGPRTGPAGARVPMLRALLAERFGLSLDHHVRTQPVFVLSVSSQAPGLRPTAGCRAAACGFRVGLGRIDATGVDLKSLAATLSTPLGRQVLVEAPHAERFDVNLRWDATGGDTVRALIHALQTQLGISVLDEQRPVPVITVRSAHRPS